MDIKLNKTSLFLSGMNILNNQNTLIQDIIFRLDPQYIGIDDWTMNGINSLNTMGLIGYSSTTDSTAVYSPYTTSGKAYYDSTIPESAEAPVTMEDFSFNFQPNTTLNMWINVRAPLQRQTYVNPSSLKNCLIRSKSGNFAFFYDKSGIPWLKNKTISFGYKCPYYLDYNLEPVNKFVFDWFQFCIGIPNTINRSGRRFIITDFAYQFNTWYLISLVATTNTLKLFINGNPTKIFQTGVNVVQTLYGKYVVGSKKPTREHLELITQKGYLNQDAADLESTFDYEISYTQKSTEIKGYSTGILHSGMDHANIQPIKRNSTISEAKSLNTNTDTGLIEVYSRAFTNQEVLNYYNDTKTPY